MSQRSSYFESAYFRKLLTENSDVAERCKQKVCKIMEIQRKTPALRSCHRAHRVILVSQLLLKFGSVLYENLCFIIKILRSQKTMPLIQLHLYDGLPQSKSKPS